MLAIDADLFAQTSEDLKSDEGFRSTAYQDHLGFWTIGYGRLIDVRRNGGISREEAEVLLHNDIIDRIHKLRQRLSWFDRLPIPAKRALVNMAFQLGVDGLLQFRNMLAALKDGDYKRAAIEAADSRWANQTPTRAERVIGWIRGAGQNHTAA